MKSIAVISALLFSCFIAQAQFPGGGGMRQGNQQNMNVGRFYGKVVDKNNKPIEAATVQLKGNRFDTVSKKMKEVILGTVLSAGNGDFAFENLPVMGKFKLKITAIGFVAYQQDISFDLKFQRGQGGNTEGGGTDRMQQMLSMVDKDLGNIKLEVDNTKQLENVTVTATSRLFEMGVDRKVFNVDKNLVSTGQTATEVMKQIPSLNVDIDGNVTMRNATPQLFIDGRPTTLTMDQIPADIIEKVELITNPSAKFDASGGNAGILNIVLKKNRKTGYNGGVRAGVDSRGRLNLGGDINLRQNKINFFLSGMFNQRKSKSWAVTDRNNFKPADQVYQTDTSTNNGYFGFIRTGFDYFIDNRNTVSLSVNFNRGNFETDAFQVIDSIKASPTHQLRNNNSEMNFRNMGAQLSYKHNFTKSGHNLSGDITYNSSKNDNDQRFVTIFQNLNGTEKYRPVLQNTVGGGSTKFTTAQIDYENPISDTKKFEAGTRIAIRDFENTNDQYFDSTGTGYVYNTKLSSRYKYLDVVYAAYSTYSVKLKNWSLQLGLRAESSNYEGTLLAREAGKSDSTFNVDYAISLFPSIFTTYKLSDKQDIQLNYSRRINRPNFFQLMPFIDYSDPQNLRVGNPGLRPEFTNSFEVSYNNNYKKGSNFLVSVFYKYNTDLITSYAYKGAFPGSTTDSAFYFTFANANSSTTFGVELTNRLAVANWWDNTINFNLFNSKINGSNIQSDLNNQRTSWFVKMNNNFKLPKNFSIQFSGNYQAKTVLPQSGGGGGRGMGGGGGGMFGGGNIGTAQGYINPRYDFDIAIRKDFTWKGGNSASVTISMNDIFRTNVYSTYTITPFFTQVSERRRDPQILRINFSYRFGKFDATLFKRKNTKAEQGAGNDMMNF